MITPANFAVPKEAISKLERPIATAINNPGSLDHAVYVLSKSGAQFISKANRYTSPAGGDWPHLLMTSTITASIEIEATAAGCKFVSQEEILLKAPETTREARKPLAIPTQIIHPYKNRKGAQVVYRSSKATEPDQLFGIDYGGTYRFFVLETDRGNMPETRLDLDDNSILRKLLAYKTIIKDGSAKKHFDLPNLFVLFVTTCEEPRTGETANRKTRLQNMLDLAGEVAPEGLKNLLFQSIPGFKPYLKTPPLFPKLFNEPYLRTGNDPFYISKA